MNITLSSRLNGIGEYYFSQKLREIEELRKQGKSIINLGIGSPDLAPHPSVTKVLAEESAKPNVHAYQSYKGSPVLREAIASWYKRWYEVELKPDGEILPLIGSKEGIMHICMTYLNAGDHVLVPNPGYPTYRSAVQLSGGVCVDYELKEVNDWLPDMLSLEAVANEGNVKLMFVNYPQMPTGKLPTKDLFETLTAFARRHDILIVHDNPYSFILNDSPLSILSVEGAKEVAIELNSLSKSQNMAGWRIGMLVGAKERIDEVMRFKSNMDSGMFLPLQLAAAEALKLGKEWHDSLNEIYRTRRSRVFQLLDELECIYSTSQAGMFVWARIPDTYKECYALSDDVLYNSGVFITPGGIFGSAGEQYIRISLCSDIVQFDEAIARVSRMKEIAI